MSRLAFILAAIAALAMAFAHVFLGGPLVVDAIRNASGLPEVVIWLSYFTWHDGTVALLVCSAAFAFVAMRPNEIVLAAFATAMMAGFGALGLATAIMGSDSLWQTPAPFAFGIIGGLGLLGIWRRPKSVMPCV
jgi:hypothetical protein